MGEERGGSKGFLWGEVEAEGVCDGDECEEEGGGEVGGVARIEEGVFVDWKRSTVVHFFREKPCF